MKANKTIKCIIVDDESIARDIIASHLAKIDRIEVMAYCGNAFEAFNYINKNEIDLIFLDINMPDITGIAFAKSIKKDIKIIFTTAYRDYAVEGFELQAVDYLLKPISFERLLKAVNILFEVTANEIKNQHNDNEDISEFMFVRSDRKMIKIDFESICYIESYSDYLKIHLENSSVITRETITSIEAKLPTETFMRIHRSYIVSLAFITSFTSEQVCLKENSIPISRSYKIEVLQRLDGYS